MTFVLKRLGQAVIVLFGVTVVVFALLQLVPGDPVRLAMGTRFDPNVYAALREAAGLDRPVLEQYLGYVGSAVTGDLGVSFRSGEPVTQLLLDRLPATVSLALVGIVIALGMALPLGTMAALRRGKVSDYVVRVVSQIGVSIPDFWMAILLILLFSVTLGWLPPAGYVPLTEDPLGWLLRILMPAFTVGIVSGSILTRYVRSSVLETLGSDHARTARAKGLPGSLVMRRHVLRNAMLPLVTIGGVQLATLLGGLVVVEVVFAWPGLGRLVFDAVQARDYPVIQGAVLLIAVMFLLINLAVDLLYAWIDPRISLS